MLKNNYLKTTINFYLLLFLKRSKKQQKQQFANIFPKR